MFAPITPRTKSPSTRHEVKQDWEKLYRAAIIESDRSKLLPIIGGRRWRRRRSLLGPKRGVPLDIVCVEYPPDDSACEDHHG